MCTLLETLENDLAMYKRKIDSCNSTLDTTEKRNTNKLAYEQGRLQALIMAKDGVEIYVDKLKALS